MEINSWTMSFVYYRSRLILATPKPVNQSDLLYLKEEPGTFTHARGSFIYDIATFISTDGIHLTRGTYRRQFNNGKCHLVSKDNHDCRVTRDRSYQRT